jgi:hypothetical protein
MKRDGETIGVLAIKAGSGIHAEVIEAIASLITLALKRQVATQPAIEMNISPTEARV